MISEHVDSYQECHYEERKYHFYKIKTLKEYLVPSLIDLVHLDNQRPTTTEEVEVYKQNREDVLSGWVGRHH